MRILVDLTVSTPAGSQVYRGDLMVSASASAHTVEACGGHQGVIDRNDVMIRDLARGKLRELGYLMNDSVVTIHSATHYPEE